jgi:hypothetical protein
MRKVRIARDFTFLFISESRAVRIAIENHPNPDEGVVRTGIHAVRRAAAWDAKQQVLIYHDPHGERGRVVVQYDSADGERTDGRGLPLAGGGRCAGRRDSDGIQQVYFPSAKRWPRTVDNAD